MGHKCRGHYFLLLRLYRNLDRLDKLVDLLQRKKEILWILLRNQRQVRNTNTGYSFIFKSELGKILLGASLPLRDRPKERTEVGCCFSSEKRRILQGRSLLLPADIHKFNKKCVILFQISPNLFLSKYSISENRYSLLLASLSIIFEFIYNFL